MNPNLEPFLKTIIDDRLPMANEQQQVRLMEIAKLILQKNIFSPGRTGIVIAGFGEKELFPTLLSFEIDDMVSDCLKFNRTNKIDIDRSGPKASVVPFAQKEMVERFLYGLDGQIEESITQFCELTAPKIRTEIVSHLEFNNDAEREALTKASQDAESAFLKALKEKAFDKIRNQSRAEIEDMVEFMPKPELAKMAEALVNLTSIKRRVSRGMETVGGPIDVAVISKSEGFVWIKRKHYFPSELNARYFERVRSQVGGEKEQRHGNSKKSGRSGPPRTGKAQGKAEQRGNVEGAAEGGDGDAKRNAESL